MKKFVSMLMVSALLITTLTACDNKSNESDSNPSSSSTATGGESSTGDGSSDNESSTSEDNASTPEDSNPNTDPTFEETGEPGGVDNSDLEFPDNKAGNLAKAALNVGEWPKMDIVLPEYMSALISPDFNPDSCEECCFASNVMSVQLNKIIVIKPNEGKESEISDAIDAYFEAVQTDPNLAFYPMQQASAEGAVKGQTNDGYYYMIVHENGADIESAMLAAV